MNLNKYLLFFWSLRRQFIKYFITGVSGVILDIASFALLKEVFGLAPVVAVVINQVFLLAYIFLINKYWSFRNKDLPHRQIVRFLILAGFNYLFSVFTMYIFNHKFEFNAYLIRICTIAVMVGWNFFLYKYWVYQITSHEAHITSQANQ
jgi:putative flippase GtrA